MCNFVESSKYFESLDLEKFEQIYQNHKSQAESNTGWLNTLSQTVKGLGLAVFGFAAPSAAALVCVVAITNPFIWIPVFLVTLVITSLLIAATIPQVGQDSSVKDEDLLNPDFKEFVKNKSQTTDEVRFHIDSKYIHFQFRAKKWEEKLAACQEKLNSHATEELVREKMKIKSHLDSLSWAILRCSYKETQDIDALLEKECNNLKWESIGTRCVSVAMDIFALLAMLTVLAGGVTAIVLCPPSLIILSVCMLTTMATTIITPAVFFAVGDLYRENANQADNTRTVLQDPAYKAYLKEHAKSSFDAIAKMRDAAFAHQFRVAKPRAELAALKAKSQTDFNHMADEKYKIFQSLTRAA